MAGRFKPTGERGSWFANHEGQRLPCVHRHWMKGTDYVDPFYNPGDRRWVELVEAIEERGSVILTSDRVDEADEPGSAPRFTRTGYIAHFAVGDVRIEDGSLKFRLVRRLST